MCSGKDLHNALYQTVHVMPQQPSALAELHVDVDAALAIGLVQGARRSLADRGRAPRRACACASPASSTRAPAAAAADLLAKHPWGAVRG